MYTHLSQIKFISIDSSDAYNLRSMPSVNITTSGQIVIEDYAIRMSYYLWEYFTQYSNSRTYIKRSEYTLFVSHLIILSFITYIVCICTCTCNLSLIYLSLSLSLLFSFFISFPSTCTCTSTCLFLSLLNVHIL